MNIFEQCIHLGVDNFFLILNVRASREVSDQTSNVQSDWISYCTCPVQIFI